MRCCQLVRGGLKFLVQRSDSPLSKATKADLSHYRSKWKREQEQWLILALPDGQITAKYDMLIGTSWTAIWPSKKVTLQFSSTGDC